MKLSPAQIANFAAAAGFQGPDLVTAVAIALAESSGETGAYNPEAQAGTAAGMGSIGLWQIYLSAHPEFAGMDLTDPAKNAAAAFQVFMGSGFRAWSTYKNGRYSAYLAAAQAGAIGQAAGAGAGGSGGDATAAANIDGSNLLPALDAGAFGSGAVPLPLFLGFAAVLVGVAVLD